MRAYTIVISPNSTHIISFVIEQVALSTRRDVTDGMNTYVSLALCVSFQIKFELAVNKRNSCNHIIT